jgi:hypothetical protein
MRLRGQGGRRSTGRGSPPGCHRGAPSVQAMMRVERALPTPSSSLAAPGHGGEPMPDGVADKDSGIVVPSPEENASAPEASRERFVTDYTAVPRALDPARSSAGCSALSGADPTSPRYLGAAPLRGRSAFQGSRSAGSYATRRVSAAISEADRAVRVAPRRFFSAFVRAGGNARRLRPCLLVLCPAWRSQTQPKRPSRGSAPRAGPGGIRRA